jgi:DNA-binding MarR family transcriptional regulator
MSTDVQVIQQLFLVERLLERPTDRIFAIHGLTAKTREILLLIRQETNTTTRLAKAMNLPLAGITQKTKVLEKKGFIQRKNGDDLREWRFTVTQKGEKALKECIPLFEAAAQKLFTDFSAAEKMMALQVLKKMTEHILTVKEEQMKKFISDLKHH